MSIVLLASNTLLQYLTGPLSHVCVLPHCATHSVGCCWVAEDMFSWTMKRRKIEIDVCAWLWFGVSFLLDPAVLACFAVL